MEEITLRDGDEVVIELGRVTPWEKRLKAPVLLAAIAVLPLVALGLSQPTGAWHTLETVGHWAVWLTFVVGIAIMLTVVDDRLAGIGGHRFELLVVLVSSALAPLALAVAPALAPAHRRRGPAKLRIVVLKYQKLTSYSWVRSPPPFPMPRASSVRPDLPQRGSEAPGVL